jgi:hypothetical protein
MTAVSDVRHPVNPVLGRPLAGFCAAVLLTELESGLGVGAEHVHHFRNRQELEPRVWMTRSQDAQTIASSAHRDGLILEPCLVSGRPGAPHTSHEVRVSRIKRPRSPGQDGEGRGVRPSRLASCPSVIA